MEITFDLCSIAVLKSQQASYVTYICSCVNESSGASDMVSETGLMKGRHVVYSQNIHIVTLETESNSHTYLASTDILGSISSLWPLSTSVGEHQELQEH